MLAALFAVEPQDSFAASSSNSYTCSVTSPNPTLISLTTANTLGLTFNAAGVPASTSTNTNYSWRFTGVPAWMPATPSYTPTSGTTHPYNSSATFNSNSPLTVGHYVITASLNGPTTGNAQCNNLPLTFSITIDVADSPIVINSEQDVTITEGVNYPSVENIQATGATWTSCSNPQYYTWEITGRGQTATCQPTTAACALCAGLPQVLPSGLSMTLSGTNCDTLKISGTPAAGAGGAAGTNYSTAVRAKGCTNWSPNLDGKFTITVNPAIPPLSISTIGLMTGQVGIPYLYSLIGTGGFTPYTWAIAGALPSGLSFNTTTALFSGTPASATQGDYNVTATLTDSHGTSVSKALSLHVNPPYVVNATDMTNYCITPAFIEPQLKPNLLLMIDSSASMYDLYYVDKGSSLRAPLYCFDQTYSNIKADGTANSYYGYFNSSTYYIYDTSNNRFTALTGAFPADSVSCSATNPQFIPGILCVDLSGTVAPITMNRFLAKGNYLNWLTSSKFDVEKEILTGGKYDGGSLDYVSESRGCVGRSFIKKPLTGDYVEGGVLPAPLDVAFGIRGPSDPANLSKPSAGGQTYIDIYYKVGGYNSGDCQTAIQEYQDPATYGQQDRRTSVLNCICPSHIGPNDCGSGTDIATKAQNAYIQSVADCYIYDTSSPHDVAGDAGNKQDYINTVHNQCSDVLNSYTPGKCANNSAVACYTDSTCTDNANTCVAGTCSKDNTITCTQNSTCQSGICQIGPYSIDVGNTALLCSSNYTGICYSGAIDATHNYSNQSAYWNGIYSDGTTTYTGDACIHNRYNAFCGLSGNPQVPDPTDNASDTSQYANVPALLSGLGLTGQMGQPIKQMRVRLAASPKDGLVQLFKNQIRFGVMGFEPYGSASECTTGSISPGAIECPKVCANDSTRLCKSLLDCDAGAACNAATNLDGGRILPHSYIGDPIYAGNPVGDHNSGIIRDIDDLRAETWTPFAETYYDAIAYFAQNTTDSSRPMRLNTADFATTINPSQNQCQANNVLLISDGMSTADQNSTVMTFVSSHHSTTGLQTTTASTNGTVVPRYFGSANLDDLAWFAKNNNIFSPSDPIRTKNQYIVPYVVYTGETCAVHDATSDVCTQVRQTDGTLVTASEVNAPELLMYDTALAGGGLFYKPQDPVTLKDNLEKVLITISRQAASGTAASVLASGEGSGANLVQAVFYPTRRFSTSTESVDINWIGRLTNLWYYIDPLFGSSSIYEDSATPGTLDLSNDNRVTLAYNPSVKKTQAQRSYDSNNDGVPDTLITPDIDFESLKGLWDAGLELWRRDLTASPRRIKTSLGSGLVNFSTSNANTLMSYLQAANTTESTNIINYVNGIDVSGYRPRSVSQAICSGSQTMGCNINVTGDCPSPQTCSNAGPYVWKLGDVVQSTPRIGTRFPLNSYDKTYGDSTYAQYIAQKRCGTPAIGAICATSADCSGTDTCNDTSFGNRGLVFAGANDGMLHAFKMGKLDLKWSGQTTFQKAKLSNPNPSTNLGHEMWAYIPKNVLPYLKYMADPNYCHVYSVDLSPYIFDASIGAPADGDVSDQTRPSDGSSWRTILIGGMRFGGACKKSTTTCTDCVKAPGVDINTDGTVSGDDEFSLGMSSYFVLDVTDTLNDPSVDPTLLWEFTSAADEDLGFATSNATVVRISSRTNPADPASGPDNSKNGKWFVVIGSGPTGSIDTTDHQFLGRSDQNLKIHIIDLKNGPTPSSGVGHWVKDTTIANAFSGSLVNGSHDANLNYQDDVVYIPYVRKCNSLTDALDPCTGGTWTDGGIGRLLTKEDPNPANWSFGKLIDGIGPVTSAVVRLETYDRSKVWVYFGSGRYYYEEDTPDDKANQRRVYGVKDPCYTSTGFDFTCTTVLSGSCASLLTDIKNVTAAADIPTNPNQLDSKAGWCVDLDLCTTSDSSTPVGCSDSTVGYRAERVVTDPLSLTTGIVFFTTMKPKEDRCSPSGKSYIWALKYDTGGTAGALLKGKAILQVSTGQIAQIDLATAFDQKVGRRAEVGTGDPPASQGLSILSSPPPVKRVIHMKER